MNSGRTKKYTIQQQKILFWWNKRRNSFLRVYPHYRTHTYTTQSTITLRNTAHKYNHYATIKGVSLCLFIFSDICMCGCESIAIHTNKSSPVVLKQLQIIRTTKKLFFLAFMRCTWVQLWLQQCFKKWRAEKIRHQKKKVFWAENFRYRTKPVHGKKSVCVFRYIFESIINCEDRKLISYWFNTQVTVSYLKLCSFYERNF